MSDWLGSSGNPTPPRRTNESGEDMYAGLGDADIADKLRRRDAKLEEAEHTIREAQTTRALMSKSNAALHDALEALSAFPSLDLAVLIAEGFERNRKE